MVRYWELKTQLPNAENQKVVNEYLLSLKVANRAFHTINCYRIFYQAFFKEEETSYAFLTSDDIQKWLIQHDMGLKKNTIRNHISALSTFYKFCVEEEYVKISPIKTRWYPRAAKPIPKYLTKEETAKIRRLLEDLPLRDRVIFEFMLTSGCRIGEVHHLDKADIDLENRTTRVVGKGKKIRQVHFSEMTELLLERYLQTRKDDHPALFVTNKENPTRLSATWVGRSMNKLGKMAELSGSLHPHRLRHTFATVLLAKGADLMFIADELGHSDIKTTQIYARLSQQQIISFYCKYMGYYLTELKKG